MPKSKSTPKSRIIPDSNDIAHITIADKQTTLLQYVIECTGIVVNEAFTQIRVRLSEKRSDSVKDTFVKHGGIIFSTPQGEETYFVQGNPETLANTSLVEQEILSALQNSASADKQSLLQSLVLRQHIEIEIAERDIVGLCQILSIQASLLKNKEIAQTALQAMLRELKWHEKIQFRYVNLPEDFTAEYEHVIIAILEQHIFSLVTLDIAGQKPKKRKPYKHAISSPSTAQADSAMDYPTNGRHVAIHLEKSQFGRTQPDPMSLTTVIHDAEVLQKAHENNIELIGIDPSWNGFRAIAALQKAFTRQGYRPEPEFIDMIDDEEIATTQGMVVRRIVRRVPNPMYNDEINSIRRAFKYKDGLPRLVYKSWTEYYEDFGVPKYETERGKVEYSGKIKLEAEAALASLVKNAFVWNYIRVRNPKTPQEIREDVTAYAPLIAAVQVIRNEVTKELEYIEIIPSPVIVDQVSTHFLIYPSDLEDQVFRALNARGKGRPPRYQLLFVKWLYLRAKENSLRPFSNTYRELGRILRMDAWIETRQDKRVRDSLEKCFKVALNLNLVLKIDRSNDRFTFYLNPEKFRRKVVPEQDVIGDVEKAE
jgi:hypothetical protein